MGFDTIGIRSPDLPEHVAQKIEEHCIARQGIELNSGTLLYQITTGQLEGSYDSRISVKVERERWTSVENRVIKVGCPPRIYIEASVHKAMIGHNINQAPTNFKDACDFLVKKVSELIDYELPNSFAWFVRRIDFALVFDLGSFDTVKEYIKGFKSAHYPRRKPMTFGFESVMFPGTTTTTKFYHKGIEFKKHDYKRVASLIGGEYADNLQKLAYNYLRVEVGIKIKKLTYDFGYEPVVCEITEKYCSEVYDKEVSKLLKLATYEKEVVRTASTVELRLKQVYGNRLGTTLLGTWFRLSTAEESEVKLNMPKSTFQRHKKFLIEAGCEWKGTDVVLKRFAIVPIDFAPLSSDRRLIA